MPRNLQGSADQRNAQRVSFLDNTDWMCRRQEDQLRRGRPTSLTDDQYNELLDYRQALRDWPVSGDYNEPFPIPPGWMP